MIKTDEQRIKQQAIDLLKEQVQRQARQLAGIDSRLLDYYVGLVEHSGTELGDENDQHCLMELLGGLKLLRLLRLYDVDVEKVQQVIRLREGDWHQEGRMWVYDRGGLLLPGTGASLTHYRWEAFQVFIWAAIYGIRAWVDTEISIGTRELLPTEREGKNGTIEDLRRLCTDFTLYGPRKIDKTGISAYNALLFFMLADNNSEIFCTANASAQSKILFERAKSLIHQLDQKEQHIRFTATEVNWKPGQIRSATLSALSAGGKTKDGLFAELCCADEYGSAAYVNGKSDMGALVSVVQSSMGPRREPLTVTTTTAGNIMAGPFVDKLAGIKMALANEIEHATDGDNPDKCLLSSDDRWMCLILEPDEWERDEEYLLSSRPLRRKINPMLGRIVQHSFYDDEIAAARRDPQKKAETITKLINVYQTSKIEEWIKPDIIRKLQIDARVDECTADKGWVVFCGMDFSMGDDLYAHGYLCVNTQTGDLLADMDAWITQETMEKVSIRPLYEKWVSDGWLHVCPGGVIDTVTPVRRIMELTGFDPDTGKFIRTGCNIMRIGYDPYRSPDPVNMLKAWVHDSLGLPPEVYVVPVSQTNGNYNQPTEQLTGVVKHPRGTLRFSMNPLWPYCFGCAVLDKDRLENKRPVKRNASDACKVDPIQALLTAWITWNHVEASERPAE